MFMSCPLRCTKSVQLLRVFSMTMAVPCIQPTLYRRPWKNARLDLLCRKRLRIDFESGITTFIGCSISMRGFTTSGNDCGPTGRGIGGKATT
uniref:Putative secreted protein n=1 Tax=Anopheles marajoara TaxID=58244 RepID=A0A2M4C9R5_9DIPT